jgi:peptidoglycan/xylan/chitin deacetylase (PgdA/CDA1 family)
MQLALKIDVDTLRGTREGVPRLVELLKKHDARATFLFSLGPDHTGRAIKRAFRPGFLKKVKRTSVLEHYGLQTLLYGTLLPGPDIGKRCAGIMRSVRDEGFEVGIHCWDHVKWQDGVMTHDDRWAERELTRARERFTDIFGEPPRVHGAAGWQMTRHALRLTQRLGFNYSSDARGTHPFLPMFNAEPIRCPQLPTTLPTLDELIGCDDITESTVAGHLLAMTQPPCAHTPVFTLHAELEGMRLAPVFELLLAGWREQGYTLAAMRDVMGALDLSKLPHHEMGYGEVPGRSGQLLQQGAEFLPDLGE